MSPYNGPGRRFAIGIVIASVIAFVLTIAPFVGYWLGGGR